MKTTERASELLPWLKAKKSEYEERGYIPTLELLIQELEDDV